MTGLHWMGLALGVVAVGVGWAGFQARAQETTTDAAERTAPEERLPRAPEPEVQTATFAVG